MAVRAAARGDRRARLAATAAGCATTTERATESPPAATSSVALERTGQTWAIAATISSPYDSPERYADAFRVLAPDGSVLGVRDLLHDHAGEQPFTRALDGVTIPDGVTEVTVEARDLANGWGGATVTVPVGG